MVIEAPKDFENIAWTGFCSNPKPCANAAVRIKKWMYLLTSTHTFAKLELMSFEYNGRTFKTHLRHSNPFHDTFYSSEYAQASRWPHEQRGHMYVAIHTDSYGKSLPFLTAMGEYLKSIIPFPATISGEMEVEKLGGPCYSNIMSVQFTIRYDLDDKTAVEKLGNIGFFVNLEYTK